MSHRLPCRLSLCGCPEVADRGDRAYVRPKAWPRAVAGYLDGRLTIFVTNRPGADVEAVVGSTAGSRTMFNSGVAQPARDTPAARRGGACGGLRQVIAVLATLDLLTATWARPPQPESRSDHRRLVRADRRLGRPRPTHRDLSRMKDVLLKAGARVQNRNIHPLPPDDPSYIERSTDQAFLNAISRGDSIVLLRGARQVGKTSLLARGLQRARSSGARTVFTDFQGFNRSELGSLDSFYQTLAGRIAQGLGIDDRLEDLWNPELPPNRRFEGFLEDKALATDPGHLVWAMDEADRLFSFDFATEFFGLLRSWHNARATEPSRPWRRLTLVIAYATTEAHLFIKDSRQSPFNVGTKVSLADFTYEEVAELNRRRGAPIKSGQELKWFQGFVGGHPFLTNRGLYEMAARGLGVRAFEKEAVREDGFLGDHLRHIVIVLEDDSALREAITGMLRGKPCPTAVDFYRLRAAGLVAGESSRSARVRCRLYEDYLREALR